MSYTPSTSDYFAAGDGRPRRPGDGITSSDSSYTRSRAPPPRRDRRSALSRDYTDRGRDLEGHHYHGLRGGRSYNPHEGRYTWSSNDDDDSDHFYPPTRIPANSFNCRRHLRRIDDSGLSYNDRVRMIDEMLGHEGYNDSQVEYGWPSWPARGMRRSSFNRLCDSIREGREDDNRRSWGRREPRSYYRDRGGSDADYEDNESGFPDGYRRRLDREMSERGTRGWITNWRNMSPDIRSDWMEHGLNELQTEYLDRNHWREEEVSEGPRERWRRRRD